MDLEKRVNNLEKLVTSIMNNLTQKNIYNESDIDGIRKNVSELNTTIFPEWIPSGYDYYVSERVSYNGKYYRCIQNHKSQPDWTPDAAVSLWVEMSDPGEEFPEWKQPTGAHDAYAKGDKVSHNSKHWTSDIDANVYEPGVYGWTEV